MTRNNWLHAVCAALLVFATASLAQAGTFSICNKTTDRLKVAVGYEDRDLGMVSEGWWDLQAGDCTNVKTPDGREHKYYFLYARGERGREWLSVDSAEEGLFCVRNSSFSFVNRSFEREGKLVCERRGATAIKFRRVDTMNAPQYTYDFVPQ
jgi:uncharacterized membrane protein